MSKEKKLLDITNNIYVIRDMKVMLDRDLAELYGVEVRAINQAVKRNQGRFPDDFMFKVNKTEFIELRSQNVIVDKQNSVRRKDQLIGVPQSFLHSTSLCCVSNLLKTRTFLAQKDVKENR